MAEVVTQYAWWQTGLARGLMLSPQVLHRLVLYGRVRDGMQHTTPHHHCP